MRLVDNAYTKKVAGMSTENKRSWADAGDRDVIAESLHDQHRRLAAALFHEREAATITALRTKLTRVVTRTTILMMAEERDQVRYARRQAELLTFAKVSLEHMARAVEAAVAGCDFEVGAVLRTISLERRVGHTGSLTIAGHLNAARGSFESDFVRTVAQTELWERGHSGALSNGRGGAPDS